ncbi:MAG TPA: FAD-dependent oxidoreductase [Bacillota bacterium]|nr:FAD-dependent oxidoreductase [Bacillota bacterium]
MIAKIVLLGGGIGGLATAHLLRKKLGAHDQVVVIDRQKSQYFNPSLLWLLSGERTPGALYRDLGCLPEHGIGFIHDEAVEIRPERKEIILKQNPPLAYDVLVLATGADYDFLEYPKLFEAGYCLHTIEGMLALRQALTEFHGGPNRHRHPLVANQMSGSGL